MGRMTIRDAAEMFARDLYAIPTGMIERVIGSAPEEWEEVTKPAAGDGAYVPGMGSRGEGTVTGYDEGSGLYEIKLDDGSTVRLGEDEFEVSRDGSLPIWGTMWSFSDSTDNWWLEKKDGIRKMSGCRFRIYRHDEFGYFFGIDGAGYDFVSAHWIPLYKARGLQWHNPDIDGPGRDCEKGGLR